MSQVSTPDKISEDIQICEISPEVVSNNERLRAAACLLGAAQIGILDGPKSTYQEDYKGLKPGKGPTTLRIARNHVPYRWCRV